MGHYPHLKAYFPKASIPSDIAYSGARWEIRAFFFHETADRKVGVRATELRENPRYGLRHGVEPPDSSPSTELTSVSRSSSARLETRKAGAGVDSEACRLHRQKNLVTKAESA